MRRAGEKEAEFRGKQRFLVSRIVAHQIEVDKRKPNQHQLGIKSTVLDVYAKQGEQAAWEKLQEINERLNGPVYTREMLQKWIKEYENRQAR